MLSVGISWAGQLASNQWVRFLVETGATATAVAYLYRRHQQQRAQEIARNLRAVSQAPALPLVGSEGPQRLPTLYGRRELTFGQAVHHEVMQILPLARLMGTPPPGLEDQLKELHAEAPRLGWGDWAIHKGLNILEGNNKRVAATKAVRLLIGAGLGIRWLVDVFANNVVAKLLAPKDEELKQRVKERFQQGYDRGFTDEEWEVHLSSSLFEFAIDMRPMSLAERLQNVKSPNFSELTDTQLVASSLVGGNLTVAAEAWFKAMDAIALPDAEKSLDDETIEFLRQKKLIDSGVQMATPLLKIVTDILVDQQSNPVVQEAFKQFIPLARKSARNEPIEACELVIASAEVLALIPPSKWDELRFKGSHEWIEILAGLGAVALALNPSAFGENERKQRARTDFESPLASILLRFGTKREEIADILATCQEMGALDPGPTGHETIADEVKALINELATDDADLADWRPLITSAIESKKVELRLRALLDRLDLVDTERDELLQAARRSGILPLWKELVERAAIDESAMDEILFELRFIDGAGIEQLENNLTISMVRLASADNLLEAVTKPLGKDRFDIADPEVAASLTYWLIERKLLNPVQLAFRNSEEEDTEINQAIRDLLSEPNVHACERLLEIIVSSARLEEQLEGLSPKIVQRAWREGSMSRLAMGHAPETTLEHLLAAYQGAPSESTEHLLMQIVEDDESLDESIVEALQDQVDDVLLEAMGDLYLFKETSNRNVLKRLILDATKDRYKLLCDYPALGTNLPLPKVRSPARDLGLVLRLKTVIQEVRSSQKRLAIQNRQHLRGLLERALYGIEGVANDLIFLAARDTSLNRGGVLQNTAADDQLLLHDALRDVKTTVLDVITEMCFDMGATTPPLPHVSGKSRTDENRLLYNAVQRALAMGGDVQIQQALFDVIGVLLDQLVEPAIGDLKEDLPALQDGLVTRGGLLLERKYHLAEQNRQLSSRLKEIDNEREGSSTTERLLLESQQAEIRRQVARLDEQQEALQTEAKDYMHKAGIAAGARLAKTLLESLLDAAQEKGAVSEIARIWRNAIPMIRAQAVEQRQVTPFDATSFLAAVAAKV